MDLQKDRQLFWIAKEGLKAPLPEKWKPCKTKESDEVYYFNFNTGESTWDHPCDEFYRKLFDDTKKKQKTVRRSSTVHETASSEKRPPRHLLSQVHLSSSRCQRGSMLHAPIADLSHGTRRRVSETLSSRTSIQLAPGTIHDFQST